MVVFGMDRVMEGKVIEPGKRLNVEGIVQDKAIAYKNFFGNSSLNSLCRKVVSTELIEKMNFEEYFHIRYGEDLLQSLPYYQKAKRIYFLNENLYNYTFNPESATNTISYNNFKVDFTVREKVFEFIQKENVFTETDYQEYRALIAFGDEDNLTCNNSCFQKYLAFKHKIKNGGRGRVRNNKIMQSADAIVHIGGSIFIENENWKSNFKPEYNENIFYIGANFGPYKSEEYRMEIESRLKATNDCCFRDSYSYNLFSKLKNTRWAPDVIFGYPFFPSYKKGDKIGISVIDYSFRNCAEGIQKKYENGIIKICNYYQALGKEILLLGFCNAEGDGIAIDRIKNKMQNIQNISWINYHGKIEEFIDALNECETIFATRFHAMILGWSMRKKVVPIVYSPKQIHVLQDLKYEGTIWNIMNGEEISDSCVCAENCELDDEILRKCIEKSQEQFRALDEFIESNARDDRER